MRLTMMKDRVELGVLLLVLGLACASVARGAGIKCWINDQNVRECGNAVPPQYSQHGYEEFSDNGMMVKETGAAKTKAQLAAEKRKRAQAAAAERRREAQKAHDRVLLETFTTEHDLVLARDSRIEALDASIQHSEGLVSKLQESLDALQAKAAAQELAGKAVPPQLQQHITEVKRQLDEDQAFIKQQRQEKVGVRETFSKDLARFRELKREGRE